MLSLRGRTPKQQPRPNLDLVWLVRPESLQGSDHLARYRSFAAKWRGGACRNLVPGVQGLGHASAQPGWSPLAPWFSFAPTADERGRWFCGRSGAGCVADTAHRLSSCDGVGGRHSVEETSRVQSCPSPCHGAAHGWGVGTGTRDKARSRQPVACADEPLYKCQGALGGRLKCHAAGGLALAATGRRCRCSGQPPPAVRQGRVLGCFRSELGQWAPVARREVGGLGQHGGIERRLPKALGCKW